MATTPYGHKTRQLDRSKAITSAISKRLRGNMGNSGPTFPGSRDRKNPGGSIPRMPGNTGPKFPSGDLYTPPRGRKGEDRKGMTALERNRMTKLKNRVRSDGKQTRQETKRVRSRRRELQNTTYQQRQARKARQDKSFVDTGKIRMPPLASNTNNPFISGAANRRLRRR